MLIQSDTRERIIDSARELILSRSYADVGVAAICDHAGVKKGSFYHFFPSKSELTQDVLDTFFADFKKGLIDQAFNNDLPPLQKLVRLSELAYEFQRSIKEQTGKVYGCPFGNLGLELSTQDEKIRHKINFIFNQLQNGLTELLTQAKEQGDVGDINIEATAQAMLAYFEGVILMAKTKNDPEIISELLPAIEFIRIIP